MKQFTLKEGSGSGFLPGVGRVKPGQILKGDHLARFAPHVLTEVLPTAEESVAMSAPRVLNEILPTVEERQSRDAPRPLMEDLPDRDSTPPEELVEQSTQTQRRGAGSNQRRRR